MPPPDEADVAETDGTTRIVRELDTRHDTSQSAGNLFRSSKFSYARGRCLMWNPIQYPGLLPLIGLAALATVFATWMIP